MAETLSAEMNTKKVLVDESTEGTIYIWLAYYPRPWNSTDWWYRCSDETASKIWKIKKITECNWVTEMSYPNWDYSASFVRDCRTCYNYI